MLESTCSMKQTEALRRRNFLRDRRIAGASIGAASTCGDRSCAGHHFLFAPRFVVADHFVQDRQQFSHAGHQSHFLDLAAREQSGVELFDDRVESSCHQRGHRQDLSDMTAASETSSLSFATSIPITRVASFELVILSHPGECELVGCDRPLKRRFGFKKQWPYDHAHPRCRSTEGGNRSVWPPDPGCRPKSDSPSRFDLRFRVINRNALASGSNRGLTLGC